MYIYCKHVFGSGFVKFESLPISHCWNPNQENITCSRSWMWVVLQDGAYGAFAEVWIHQEKSETVVWSRGVWIPERTPIFWVSVSHAVPVVFHLSLNIKHKIEYITKSKQKSSFCANTVMTIFSMKPANSGIHAWQSDHFAMQQDSEVPRLADLEFFHEDGDVMVASAEKNPSTIFGLGHLVGEMFDSFFLRHIAKLPFLGIRRLYSKGLWSSASAYPTLVFFHARGELGTGWSPSRIIDPKIVIWKRLIQHVSGEFTFISLWWIHLYLNEFSQVARKLITWAKAVGGWMTKLHACAGCIW